MLCGPCLSCFLKYLLLRKGEERNIFPILVYPPKAHSTHICVRPKTSWLSPGWQAPKDLGYLVLPSQISCGATGTQGTMTWNNASNWNVAAPYLVSYERQNVLRNKFFKKSESLFFSEPCLFKCDVGINTNEISCLGLLQNNLRWDEWRRATWTWAGISPGWRLKLDDGYMGFIMLVCLLW